MPLKMHHRLLTVLAAFSCFYGSSLLFADSSELERIQQYINDNGYNWTAAETSVSELTAEERRKLNGLRMPLDFQEPASTESFHGQSLPSRYDWREHNGVTAVRNQGSCGSCWAFGALAAFESAIYIRTGVQMDLSEQQILSCNTRQYGCDGGWFDGAYEVMQNPGSVQESCMPYHQNDTDPCRQNDCAIAARIDSWNFLSNNMNSIKTALLQGPVSTGMVVFDDFYYYSGGCYENTSNGELNHGVAIVGWDDNYCGGVWIVKNSWGKRWGENGFAYIRYGSCKLGTGASQPYFNASSGPTPTPVPSTPNIVLDLTMSSNSFSAGDLFKVGLDIRNLGNHLTVDLAICLDVFGAYYFWPNWSTNLNFEPLSLSKNQHYADVILEFTWPQGNFGSAENLKVIAGAFQTGSQELIEYDMSTFSFH